MAVKVLKATMMRGVVADRPSLRLDTLAAVFFFATDEDKLYYCDSDEWLEVTTPEGTQVTNAMLAGSITRDKLAGGFSKLTVADGTNAAVDVTVSGMAVGDELVKVIALTTKASIASLADRTSEYVVAAGKLTKAAGTDETDNQLLIYWTDLT